MRSDIGGPPNKKGRPRAAVQAALLSDVGARMAPSCKARHLPGTQVGLADLRIKKPISGRPEIGPQFQLWIFSYTIRAWSSKKWVSRVLIGPTTNSVERQVIADPTP